MLDNKDLIKAIKALTLAVKELTEELRYEREREEEEKPGYSITGISPEEFLIKAAVTRG
ncbi:hypothetical protein MUK70_11975 [Dyadobacter chenwenxiniae]|uniref:Uncharacterized protein n=1 Tax=Dyadobacter chenwenxiniae TaxID=2906456 RepID=A0A9X1PGT4_9BACT|nr:hypothetical protein [Dyadobacter chenwenxiniae]MCF0059960.1 hypothetical protein [Dyadobacter chenwenxiniae]UON85699.1 hypothetical protein MUK70_11975 [Dyadobacter chenwenxiniae]